jgi:uncharacterized membrane protein YtjA (UPF0391 family)
MDNSQRPINQAIAARRGGPVSASTPAPSQALPTSVSIPTQHVPQRKVKKSKSKIVFLIIAIIVLLGVLGFGAMRLAGTSTSAAIDTNKYQAVFFTNGQVYFGKLQTLNGNYLKLTNIFYLQTATASTNPQQTNTSTNANVQLIKLGSEVHGPEDEMIISKDQVLFFENLKSDGKVTQSINSYKP